MIDAHSGHLVAAASAGTVALRVLLLVGAAVLAGAAVSSRRWWTLPLLAAPVLVAVGGPVGWTTAVVAVHVAAASLWLGTVARAVWTHRWSGLGPLAASSAGTVALTGGLLAWSARVRLDGLLFDRLVLLKAGLLVVAVALGARRLRVELLPLVAAAAVGAALVAVPVAPEAGTPLVAAGLTVVPQRPGPNLVHLAVDEPVTVDGVTSRAEPGTTGQWLTLDLPAGRSRLALGPTGTAVVDTGDGPPLPVDGPECASVVLQGATSCPSAALHADDAAALTSLDSWLRSRGVGYRVAGDGSPRSAAAARVLRPEGVPTAVVLTGGWDSAARELQRLGRSAPAGGVYLAPWLLNGPLLARYAVTAPYVVLPVDPTSQPARDYAASLPVGEVPSLAGYRAWGGPAAAPRVWATSPASIFPKDLSHDHPAAAGWFPGGALVAVS